MQNKQELSNKGLRDISQTNKKTTRHKWGDGRRNFAVCSICGCEKHRGVYSIRYELNGNTTQEAPPCIEQDKWVMIERGYNGSRQKWKLGDRIFTASRAMYGAYKWYFYELPNMYSGQEVYTDVGDFREVLKRFKLFIQPKK